MKTTIRVVGVLTVLCGTFIAASVFGQTTYTWTNQSPGLLTAGDLNQAANWSPNGVPRPDFQNGITWGDEMLFDDRTTGPLVATQNGGSQANGGGSGQPYGLRVHLSSNQTNSVTIVSPVGTSGGMRMNYFTVDAGSGGLVLGNETANVLDIVAGVLNGQILGFTNDSVTPSRLMQGLRFRLGGAGVHPFVIAGSGDWMVNNHLRSADGSGSMLIQKEGPGTMTWTGTNIGPRAVNWFGNVASPVRINGGTMILKSSDLVGTDAGGPNIVHNGVLLKYDVQPVPGYVTGPATLSGNISGSGPIQINAGMLTLSGANTFTGSLALSGGTVIAGSTEAVGLSGPLGNGGTISFSGGTVQYSANNAFDYSSRFSTAAGQTISIDTAGQSVTFATGLTSSGGTLAKTNSGTLTLVGASSYSGATTISGGKLVFQAVKTGAGDITVADGATLGVFDTGTPVTPATLTLGTSAGANLEFDNINSTTTAPLKPGAVSSAGTTLISINNGTFAVGQSYPLLQWTSGSAPAVSLGTVSGANGTLSTNGNKIQFNVTSVAPVWTGAISGNWSDPSNWTTPYSDPKSVRFDDTAPGTTSVTVDVQVQPASVTVINSTKPYNITSSGINNIAGGTGLTKSGGGTLTLSGGANTYTGVTALKGGTVIVGALANGGFASDIGAASSSAANLIFDGGALQYTGGATTMDRLFTVGFNGGTIDSSGSGALTLNNPGTINLGGTLTLSGNSADDCTLAAALFNGGGLNKSGAGTWILTGTNSYGGGTTISGGMLQVGAGGSTGSLGIGNVTNNSVLNFNRTGALTVPGVVSGSGSVTNNGTGTVILVNNNTYSGGTTINAGTLQVGNGGGTGSLNSTVPIVNNSLLVFNTSGSFTYSGVGVINGPGNVIVQGGGVIKVLCYADGYTGWTRIDPNTTFQPRQGQDGVLASAVVTNNGTLRIVSQNADFTYSGPIRGSGKVQIGASAMVGTSTLTGTNTYTGGTFIEGATLVLGDGVTPASGSILGNVQFVISTISQDNPRTLVFNRPDDFTFAGNIVTNFTSPQANLGIVQQNGTGTLTLTGNNTYGSGTVINNGAVQVGNGGTSGSLGSGPVTDHSQLVFNRAGSLQVGTVTGLGSIANLGTGTVTFTGASSIDGDLNLQAGTFGAAPAGAIGSFTVAGNMTIASGATVLAGLNRSLSPSNSVYTVFGLINHTNGGTLRLINGGPLLVVGDKFTLFSQPVTNMTIVSPGFSVLNNLGVDGSVTVTSVQPAPSITPSIAGNQLTLSWPVEWTGGVHLQVQTNTLAKGLSSNWVTLSGTDLTNSFTSPFNRSDNVSVFYRLIAP